MGVALCILFRRVSLALTAARPVTPSLHTASMELLAGALWPAT